MKSFTVKLIVDENVPLKDLASLKIDSHGCELNKCILINACLGSCFCCTKRTKYNRLWALSSTDMYAGLVMKHLFTALSLS